MKHDVEPHSFEVRYLTSSGYLLLQGDVCGDGLRALTWGKDFPERRSLPVTDPELDAPDGAFVDGYERRGDRWVPV